MFISFNDFVLSEKLSTPNVDFVNSILWKLKEKFFQSDDMLDLNEDSIIKHLNDSFKKYNILFSADYNPESLAKELTTKELRVLGIGGAITLIDGKIILIILNNFFENFNKKYADRLYKRFVNNIATVIGHELIHREQLSRMNPQYIKELASGRGASIGSNKAITPHTYYSHSQEISAFAYQAINDLIRHGFVGDALKNFLKNPQKWLGNNPNNWATEKNFKKFSSSYIIYYQLFKESDPDVWNKFEKLLYQFSQDSV